MTPILDKYGYVLVPKEPTMKMVDAGIRANGSQDPKFKSIYRAMVDAGKVEVECSDEQ